MFARSFKMKFVLFFLFHTVFFEIFSVHSVTRFKTVPSKNFKSSKHVGTSLILTPFLENGEIKKARNESNVLPLMKNIASNAGFFTVDKRFDSNLYFWFVRKITSDWYKAPVLLFLQGGPGCSSVYSLFGETGPFYRTKRSLKRRKYAWTNHYNVLYIDQPVGSGFSFTNSSEGYLSNQDQIADSLYEALNQFFQLYPELKGNDFYVTGESYAGKYIPAIAYRIHSLKKLKKFSINMKGLFIISGFYDPVNMMHYGKYAHHVGILDFRTRKEIEALEDDVRAHIHANMWSNATEKRLLIKEIVSKVGQIWDYRKQEFEIDEYYVAYVQTSKIRKIIHVGNAAFEECSTKVFNAFYNDIMKSVKPWVEELVEYYPVAFVGGQFDVAVAYPFVVNALEKLEWSGAHKYRTAERKFLYDDNHVFGYVKSAGNLKDVLIRNAGHMIPGDQPKFALKVLDMFIKNEL